uniref:Uncharacterized protein n=1 Tax=Acrobeloides nanus TaxID=290746 RepID=A0A914DSJ9_9BILA
MNENLKFTFRISVDMHPFAQQLPLLNGQQPQHGTLPDDDAQHTYPESHPKHPRPHKHGVSSEQVAY